VRLQDDAILSRERERGVPASPYIVREAGLQVGSEREYKLSTSRSPLYSVRHVQFPIRVLLLYSPCASRQQVPCSASRVVPGAHRVVGPGTHRGSGPKEVHTTQPPNDSQESVSKGRNLMRSIIDQQMSSNGGGSVTAKS
jgi:hypothetical protein